MNHIKPFHLTDKFSNFKTTVQSVFYVILLAYEHRKKRNHTEEKPPTASKHLLNYLDILNDNKALGKSLEINKISQIVSKIKPEEINQAFTKSLAIDNPNLWSLFLDNPEIKRNVDFSDYNHFLQIARYNSLGAVSFLLEEQRDVLSDAKKSRLILKQCIEHENSVLTQKLLEAGIKTNYFIENNSLSDLKDYEENAVTQLIKSYSLNEKLQTHLVVKSTKQERRKKI